MGKRGRHYALCASRPAVFSWRPSLVCLSCFALLVCVSFPPLTRTSAHTHTPDRGPAAAAIYSATTAAAAAAAAAVAAATTATETTALGSLGAGLLLLQLPGAEDPGRAGRCRVGGGKIRKGRCSVIGVGCTCDVVLMFFFFSCPHRDAYFLSLVTTG